MSLDLWTYSPNVAPESLGDLEYNEYRESGKETYATNNSTATRVFDVAWEVRPDFLDDLIGYSFVANGGGISRILPDEHPEISNFFANDASVEGIGIPGKNDNDAIAWTLARVTSNYKPRDYDLLDDADVAAFNVTGDSPELHRYTTRNYSFNVEYLSVNGSMIFVTATGSPPVKRTIPNPPGKAIGTMGLQYIWHEVPALATNPFMPPNLTAIKACLGKINSEVFDNSGGAYPKGTVLFAGVDPKMIMPKLTDDVFYWDITFTFLYRNQGFVSSIGEYAGHNFLFRPELGWDLLSVDGTTGGNRIYQQSDLNSLWTLG